MIFVTVGTHEQPFNRLIEAVDVLRGTGVIDEPVIIQTGFSTYEPQHCEWRKLLPYSEMMGKVAEGKTIQQYGKIVESMRSKTLNSNNKRFNDKLETITCTMFSRKAA